MKRRSFLKTSSLAIVGAGGMSIENLFRFARQTGFSAADLTAYYIPGYPEVPDDRELYRIKKMVFRMGMALAGTGVRNDFTLSDPDQLAKEIELVKEWIVGPDLFMDIVQKYPYEGFFPLETLGEVDPKAKVENLYRKVTQFLH